MDTAAGTLLALHGAQRQTGLAAAFARMGAAQERALADMLAAAAANAAALAAAPPGQGTVVDVRA